MDAALDRSSVVVDGAAGEGAVSVWWRPQNVFLVFMLIFGSAMVFITPPLQAPDEPGHFYRIWQLSEGILLSHDYGADIPKSIHRLVDSYYFQLVNQTANRISWREQWEDFHKPLNAKDVEFQQCMGGALYSPVPYLPQSIGVFVARSLNWAPIGVLYAGRLGGVIGYALLGWLSIRILPVLKWPACIAMTGPMAVFIAAALSADPMSTAIATLTVALSLRMILAAKPPGRGVAIGLGLSVLALALCKPAYLPVALLVWVVPGRNWNSRFWWAWPASIFAVAVVTIMAWSAVTHPMGVREISGGVPPEQFHYVMYHPGTYLANVGRTFWRDYVIVLEEGVGGLGWLDAGMARPFDHVYVAAVIWVVLCYGERFSLPFRGRLAAAVGVVGSFFMITFANYLIWTPPKARFTEGLQGRYFLPLVVLFFVVIQRRGRYAIVPKWVAVGMTGCILLAYWTLLERYYL